MEKALYIFIFISFSRQILGQTTQSYSHAKLSGVKCHNYSGASNDKVYNCTIEIACDSTVVLVYNTPANEYYAEYFGSIKKKSGNLFHISATLVLGKSDVKRLYTEDPLNHFVNDTDYFSVDTTFLEQLGSITIKYSNGKTEKYSPNKTKPLNKNYFNTKEAFNYYTILTEAKNKITGQNLEFKVPYGSSPSFNKDETIELDVIIGHNNLKSTGQPLLQTGHIHLSRKNGS